MRSPLNLFLEDAKRFAEILNVAASDMGESVIDDAGNTAFILRLSSGLRIHSMSSDPDAQAGKRGTRVLDEFALHLDLADYTKPATRKSLGRAVGDFLQRIAAPPITLIS